MIIDLLQWAAILYLVLSTNNSKFNGIASEVKKLKDIHKGHPGI